MNNDKIVQLAVNTIRTLSIDAVQAAKSGHPGTPMALAPLVYTIWNRAMNFDPQYPIWPNRDRFVLSNGHASMLLWSILHLTKVQAVNADYEKLGKPSVSLDDIRRFRQLDSKAPGHPEYHWVSGVETTTGPLGQGVATSVGMAIAQKWLANRYNKPGFDIFNYNIYAVCGDGCMMEGIASEAASLAGHLGLDNLCWVWDNNHITIEGNTSITFTEDVAARFLAYGWNVLRRRRRQRHRAHRERPRGIPPDPGPADVHCARQPHRLRFAAQTGHFRSPRRTAGRGGSHDSPSAIMAGRKTRSFSCPTACTTISLPASVSAARRPGRTGRNSSRPIAPSIRIWRPRSTRCSAANCRTGWDRNLPSFPADPKGVAGREASGKVLNVLAQNIPWLLGGSADLGPSNKTALTYEGAGNFQAGTPGGKNLHYGIREHAMGAVVNGLSLSKLRGYGSTFFIFSDYARPAIRLSALMELPTIFVFTHDAMGDGEDGPTHQPVEHLASLRAIPGLVTLRPGDANEVVEAYRYIMQLRHKPAVLALSRQPLPTLDRTKYASAAGVAKGAYVLADAPGENPEVILIATGSEVSLAVQAHEKLVAEGIRSRVVSMPSWDIFEHQPKEYRDSVLPPDVKARLAIEQASTFGWERYVGDAGRVIGMKTFGASAPLKELQKKFGFEPDSVVAVARELRGASKPPV